MKTPASDMRLFPSVLYGTDREAHAAWRKLSSRVATVGNWQSVLAETEFASIENYPGEIIISGGSGYGQRASKESEWRVYLCTDFTSLYKNSQRKSIDYDLLAQLTVDGMQYLWFALSTLGMESSDEPLFQFMSNQELTRDYYNLVADSLVRWLDHFAEIAPRFGDRSLEIDMKRQIGGTCWWLRKVIYFVLRALFDHGLQMENPLQIDKSTGMWWKPIDDQFHGDGIAWLISKEVIVRTPEGLKINYAFATNGNAQH